MPRGRIVSRGTSTRDLLKAVTAPARATSSTPMSQDLEGNRGRPGTQAVTSGAPVGWILQGGEDPGASMVGVPDDPPRRTAAQRPIEAYATIRHSGTRWRRPQC